MSEKKASFDQPFMTKTTDVPREALDTMVARLRSRQKLRWKDKKVTREAFVNALWLWAEELGPEAIERGLAPHLARLEELIGHGSDRPEVDFGHGKPVDGGPRPRKKRSG